MKLSSARLRQTLTQFQAQPIPDDHPAVPQLNRLFGEHTFFLDRNGLSIVEPTGSDASAHTATVIKLARWQGAEQTSLTPHEPEATDVVIALDDEGAEGEDDGGDGAARA